MSSRIPFLVLLSLLLAAPALGEDPQPTGLARPPATPGKGARELEEVVVTASKVPIQERDLTQQIRVIDAEEISQLPAPPNRNISEILSYQPGIFVAPLSRNDANWGSNGGLGPKYNSYLLDGLPIDSFIDGTSLDPWALSRVEVQRGPAAVMYSNYLAMDFAGNTTPLAGITNFVLRERVDAPVTRLQAGLGSWATVNAQAYTQGRSGDLHYFFGGSWEHADYTNYGTPGSWLNMQQLPQYTSVRLYGKTTFFFGGPEQTDQSVSVFAHYYGHSGAVGRPNRDFAYGYGTINAVYNAQLAPTLNLQVKGGARLYDRRWGEDCLGVDPATTPACVPGPLSLREHDGVNQMVFPGDATVNWKHLGASQLTAGADVQYATYKTYGEVAGVRRSGNDATAFATGLYAQETLVLGDFVARAGLRYSYSEQSYVLLGGAAPGIPSKSWDKVLWSGGARWNALPELSVFANAGSSFVAPTPKAVGGTLQSSDLGVPGRNGQLPNPNLQPESGIGLDLGLDARPIQTLKISLRAFWNQINDVIVDNVVSQIPSQTQSINAGNGTSYGLELAFDQALNEVVSWFVNGTYTRSSISNPIDPGQDGAQIPFVPNWMANFGATFTLPYGFTISPYLRGVGVYYDSTSLAGRQLFGPYWIPALRVQNVIPVANAYDVVLAVDLNNLANNQFAMPWGFKDPGINVFGTVGVRIK